jgi:hypothetical protein
MRHVSLCRIHETNALSYQQRLQNNLLFLARIADGNFTSQQMKELFDQKKTQVGGETKSSEYES